MADYFPVRIGPAIRGTLRALRDDVTAGLVGSIERRATGEVIADMLGLAKEALRDDREGAKNVAAVLAAAAFEDAIRRLGALAANVTERIDLGAVLQALRKADALVGAPATTAQSYLKFRNDALHADWERIDRGVVASAIAFTEHLILQHFS